MPEHPIVRIALLGPESTGKSTLAERLAEQYQTVWVPEFARTYLATLDHPYTAADVLHCFREQVAAEDSATAAASRLLFCDTEIINFRVWLLYRFGHCPSFVSDAWTHRYDFYLLTYPDIAFEPDPLREHPGRRLFFFDWYRRELEMRGANYSVIKGEGEARIRNAKLALDQFLAARAQ
ncbi:MAG: AAA family ATPase [Bacteroidota bacterium]|jgi:NadR type nicotinamide-nucleotide adenylyltransferase|nr:ATP-binding protein [Bacteroidia bacterium]HPD54796.1 ATP-binding protein [Bacteroidia bacterium]HRS38345.1 ATP-binding protein [Bacteroidia bacterium]HRU62264.1 ATP-binding protein [Bacteroidia bacterium]